MNLLLHFLAILDIVVALPAVTRPISKSFLQSSSVPNVVLGTTSQNSRHTWIPQCGSCMRRRDASLCLVARGSIRNSITPMELAVPYDKLCNSCILQQDIASCQSAVSTQLSALQLHATQAASHGQIQAGIVFFRQAPPVLTAANAVPVARAMQEANMPSLLQYENRSGHNLNQSSNASTTVIEEDGGSETQTINIKVDPAPAPTIERAAEKVEFAAFDSPVLWLLIFCVIVIVVTFGLLGCCKCCVDPKDSQLYKIDKSQTDKLKNDPDFQVLSKIKDDDEPLFATLVRILAEGREHVEEGQVSEMRGNMLFAAGLICGALVPVLVANMGHFGEDVDEQLQISAIILSVVAVIAAGLEKVYDFRRLGQIRISYGKQMMELLSTYSDKCHHQSAKVRLTYAQKVLDSYKRPFPEHYERLKRDANLLRKAMDEEIKNQAYKKMVKSFMRLQSKVRKTMAGDSDSDSEDERKEASGMVDDDEEEEGDAKTNKNQSEPGQGTPGTTAAPLSGVHQ